MTRRRWISVLVATIVVLVAAAAQYGEAGQDVPATGAAVQPEPGAEASTARRRAIEATQARIQKQLEANGGSWEAWAERLDPFRKDLDRIRRTGWPWKAKRNFVFQGRAAQLMLADRLDGQPAGSRPIDGIVRFDRALKKRGIDLIVMIIPDKLAVYPDYLSAKTPEDRLVSVAVKRLMHELGEQDVEVVDLYTAFRDLRNELGEEKPLYYVRDSHWRNRAARHAADLVAERLERYDFVQEATEQEARFEAKMVERTDGEKADTVRVITDREGRKYQDVGQSPVVVTGDSFSMYNMHLGGQFSAQLSEKINMPVTLMCREGLSATVPIEIANAEARSGFLKGRKVVVWTFVARILVRSKWYAIDLAEAARAEEPMITDSEARATIASLSDLPRKDADYPNFVMQMHVTGLADRRGRKMGSGEAIVRILGMRDRELLPPADLKEGEAVRLRLTSWPVVASQYGTWMTGALDDEDLQLRLPLYWGELIQGK